MKHTDKPTTTASARQKERKDKIAYSTGPLPHPWIEKPELEDKAQHDWTETVRRMCEEGDPRHDGELTQTFPKYPEKSTNPRFAPKASAPETRPTDEDNVGSTWNWLPAKVEQARTIPAETRTNEQWEEWLGGDGSADTIIPAEKRTDEAYAIAYNVDRGDGSKLAALIDERDSLQAQAAQLAFALRQCVYAADTRKAIRQARETLAAYEEGK